MRASLRRLGVERIDLYQVHWPDWTTGTPLEESWGTMAELVDEGKARWIGVSNFDVEQLERCEAIRHVDSVQPPLSLLARGAPTTVVAVGGGPRHRRARLLADGLGPAHRRASTRAHRRASTRATGAATRPAFQEPRVTGTSSSSSACGRSPSASGTTVPALAVAWVLAQPGVTGAIVGARLPRHVDGWAGAPTSSSTQAALAEIDAAVAATGAGSDEPADAAAAHPAPVRTRRTDR